MEGALASVVGGLRRRRSIAVPTSVGYGASFGGVTALLAMLNSCVAGRGGREHRQRIRRGLPGGRSSTARLHREPNGTDTFDGARVPVRLDASVAVGAHGASVRTRQDARSVLRARLRRARLPLPVDRQGVPGRAPLNRALELWTRRVGDAAPIRASLREDGRPWEYPPCAAPHPCLMAIVFSVVNPCSASKPFSRP